MYQWCFWGIYPIPSMVLTHVLRNVFILTKITTFCTIWQYVGRFWFQFYYKKQKNITLITLSNVSQYCLDIYALSMSIPWFHSIQSSIMIDAVLWNNTVEPHLSVSYLPTFGIIQTCSTSPQIWRSIESYRQTHLQLLEPLLSNPIAYLPYS